MDSQPFIDIPIGKPILWIGLATVLPWLWFSYVNSPARKLGHFPTVGSSFPILSFIHSIKFFTSARDILDTGLRKWPDGLFKVPTPYGWWVVVTLPGDIEDVRKAPDYTLSASAHNDDILQVPYTFGSEITHNPYHLPLLSLRLTRALPKLLPEIHAEMEDAFKEYIPATAEWMSVKALQTSIQVIARLMNRTLVGLPLCRDPEWIKLNTDFTKDAFTMSFVLRPFPEFLRPLVNYLITPVERHRRAGLKHLGSIIAAHRQEKGDDKAENQVDFLTWLMDEAQGEEKQDEYLLRRILALNFASVHTTSMAFTQALYNLALYSEYQSALLEEVENATNKEGWTKAAVDQMYKMDSFVKESQRLHPLGAVSISRKVLKEYTFANGMKVPPGTFVVVSSITNSDPEVFDHPSKFDGLRFLKMKERAINEGYPDKKFDMVTTSPHALAFGHGKGACPGRFLAASVIKMMLAYILVTYDVKLTDGVRPPDMFVMHNRIPNRTAAVLFRKRTV